MLVRLSTLVRWTITCTLYLYQHPHCTMLNALTLFRYNKNLLKKVLFLTGSSGTMVIMVFGEVDYSESKNTIHRSLY